jgi:SAM-dependent methyltransferase
MSRLSKGGSLKLSESSFYDIEGDHVKRYIWVSQFVDNKVVLDVGCGPGYGAHFLAGKAKFVLGVDNDNQAIEYAFNHYSRTNLIFRLADIESAKIDGQFDIAVSFELLEHLAQPKRYLENVRNCLSPTGSFFLSTPNRLYWERMYVNGRSTNPHHVKEYYPEECVELLSSYFEVDSIYVEYEKGGLDERIVQRARQENVSRVPRNIRRLFPNRLKAWYADRFTDFEKIGSVKGKYQDYLIQEVDSIKQIDDRKPIQIYSLIQRG